MDWQNQIELEKLFNKNQTLTRIKSEFRISEIVDHLTESRIPLEFGLDLLTQMVLHKRANVSTLVGLLHNHFHTRGEKPETAHLQECTDMLLRAAEADLVDWEDLSQQFIVRIGVSQDVLDDLERYQYPLPMVVEPREVKTNRETGYLTSKGSIILRDNHHDDDVCLDHINRVNRVKLRINPDVARMIQNEWKHLDKKKPTERKADYDRRVRCFEKYDRTARDVMQHLFIADGKGEFYLTHKYDKRGRCYAQGYHVNTQGNPWNRAVIELANQELVKS